MSAPVVVGTVNGQTVTVVAGDPVTVRVAKDKHNRAVLKLDPAGVAALIEALRGTQES